MIGLMESDKISKYFISQISFKVIASGIYFVTFIFFNNRVIFHTYGELTLKYIFSIPKKLTPTKIRASQVVRVVKNPPASAGDMHSTSGSGKSPGEGKGNILQYSCLEKPTDRGAWRATGHVAIKNLMRLSTHACPNVVEWGWGDTLVTGEHTWGSDVSFAHYTQQG